MGTLKMTLTTEAILIPRLYAIQNPFQVESKPQFQIQVLVYFGEHLVIQNNNCSKPEAVKHLEGWDMLYNIHFMLRTTFVT